MAVDREFLYREFDEISLTSRVRLCQVRVVGGLGLSRAPASVSQVSFRVHETRLGEAKSRLAKARRELEYRAMFFFTF